MVVVVAVLFAYLVIRVVSYWRSSVDVETLASQTVAPIEARRRLGCAESLGIRVVDVTRLADGLKRTGSLRERRALLVWAFVPSLFVYLGWNAWLGAVILWASLVSSSITALFEFGEAVSAQTTKASRATSIVACIALLAVLFAGSYQTLVGAQSWGWPWPESPEALAAGTISAIIGIALVALYPWCFSLLLRAANRRPDMGGFIRGADRTLWLRAFDDDVVTVRAVGPFGVLTCFSGFRVRLEELVAQWSDVDGMLVAIGKPGERYPLLGATRTYVPDRDWQRVVARAVGNAGAILLLAGSTAGLGWELDLVSGGSGRRRVLLLLPPLPYEQSIARFLSLRRQLQLSDLEALDHYVKEGTSIQFSLTVVAIGFSESGRPVYYVSRGRSAADLEATVKTGQLLIRGKLL